MLKKTILLLSIFTISGINAENTQITQIKDQLVILKAGDKVSFNFEADGNLFESFGENKNQLIMKKDLFLKTKNGKYLVSKDGEKFISLTQAINGKLDISSSVDNNNFPDLIQILMSVYLK